MINRNTFITIIALSLAITFFAGCSDESLNTIPVEISETEVTETVISETIETEITDETTEETQLSYSEEMFAVETVQYSTDIIYSDEVARQIMTLLWSNSNGVWVGDRDPLYFMGFDNYRLRNEIINYYQSRTGIYDEALTLADFHSLQFARSWTSPLYEEGDPYDWREYWVEELSIENALSRIVLSRLGLRYWIDEIPAWFFEENFPEYTYWFTDQNSDYDDDWNWLHLLHGTDYSIDWYINSTDEAQRYFVFLALYEYNSYRSTLIYNFWGGDEDYIADDVVQVRDEDTGRYVLVPTEEQYYAIIDYLHGAATFENIDISRPETEEELYDIFGVSPEEIIPYDLYSYQSSTFSYNDGVPSFG